MGRFDKLEISRNKPDPFSGNGESAELYDADRFLKLAVENYWEGNYEEALRYFSKALGEDVSIKEAWIGQVRCLFHLFEYPEALLWVDKALDRFPDSAELLALKAVAYQRTGLLKYAIEFADAAVAIKDASTFVWVARGDVLISMNMKNAERCFLKALEQDKTNWRLMAEIADAFYAHKNYHKSLEYFLRIIEHQPQNARIWLMISRCRKFLGLKGYREAVEKALNLRPNWIEAVNETRIKPSRMPLVKIKNWISRTFIR